MNALTLNLRAKTLTGYLGGKPINLPVQPGSGMLTQTKPGRYIIRQPVNDPSAGWIAAVEPVGANKAGNYLKLGDINGESRSFLKLGDINGKSRSFLKLGDINGMKESLLKDAGFLITMRSLGGWNDLVLPAGADFMTQLKRLQGIELQVV